MCIHDAQWTVGFQLQVEVIGTPGAETTPVAAGADHTLAVLEDGTVWAAGSNASGQLGVDPTDPLSGLLVAATANSAQLDAASTGTSSGTLVPGMTSVRSVAAGNGYSLGLTSTGAVWSWGDNSFGQLGDGSSAPKRSIPAPVPGVSGFVKISAGQRHALALTSQGHVWAWGENNIGQLGDGSVGAPRSKPVQVAGLNGVVDIAAGSKFSLALDRYGIVWAWGTDDDGELGNDVAKTSSPVPVQVALDGPGKSLAAGADHAVVAMADGTVRSWGSNALGQLGIGDATVARSTTPVQVPGLVGTTTVGAGAANSFAVHGSTSTLSGWGKNNQYQLGDNQSPPIQPRVGAGSCRRPVQWCDDRRRRPRPHRRC